MGKAKLPRTLILAIPLILFTGLLYLTGVIGDLFFVASLILGVIGVWRAMKGRFRLPGRNIILFSVFFLLPYFTGWAIIVVTESPIIMGLGSNSKETSALGTFHEIGVGHTVEVAVRRAWLGLIPLTSEFGWLLPYHILYTLVAVGSAVGLSRRVTIG